MVKLYVRRIRAGMMTIDKAPARWRDAVKLALEE